MRVIFFILITLFSLHASDWKKMYGHYVTVEFNPGYEILADSIVNMADRAMPRLAALQGVPLASFEKTKTRIILTDAPDISNGYAIENAVVLYVRASMYMDMWSGAHSWHKMVLEHELAHHVTFRALWRKSNYLGAGFTLSAPRWLFEGTAQYFAETWTPYRGDIYLKGAVLNGQLNYNSLTELSNGRLLYAVAHAFVRYLADQYGDSALIALLNHDKESFFYNFNEAFKHVYDKSPQKMFAYFLRHMIVYYGNQAADYPQLEVKHLLPQFGYRDIQVIPLQGQDSTYLVKTVLEENHLYTSAVIFHIANGKKEIVEIISDNFTTSLYISPDQHYLAFGRFNVSVKANQQSIDYQWSIYDLQTHETSGTIDNVRAFEAGFNHKNELILVTVVGTRSIIRLYNIKGHMINDLYKTEMAVGGVLGMANGAIIFEAQKKNNQRDLFILNKNQLHSLTDDSVDNRNPMEMGSRLVFNQMVDNNPVVSLFDIEAKTTRILINAQDPVFAQYCDSNSKSIIVAFRDAGANSMFAELSVDTLLNNPVVPVDRDNHPRYASWVTRVAVADSIEESQPAVLNSKNIEKKLFPQGNLIQLQTIPIPVYDKQDGAGLFLLSLWMEALQRQILFVNSYLLFNNWQDSYLALLHYIKAFNLDISSFYYHGPGIITRINGDYSELVHDYLEISAGKYTYWDGNTYLPYALMASYRIDRFDKAQTELDYSYHGPALYVGIGYELPSRYQNIFPKRALKGSVSYFKSIQKEWDFSIIDFSIQAGTNLYSEKIGLTTRAHYIQTQGNVSPSALTGIDQDYSYAIPRDYLNTKTIRGIRRNYFGDKLIWNSSELTLLVAQHTSMKILFLPVNDLAISGFFDVARVENSDINQLTNLYSYGSELSIGFGPLRVGAGYAAGNIDGTSLDGEYYGRLHLNISDVFNGTGLK